MLLVALSQRSGGKSCVIRSRPSLLLFKPWPEGPGSITYTLNTIYIVSTGADYFDGGALLGQFRPRVPVVARNMEYRPGPLEK